MIWTAIEARLPAADVVVLVYCAAGEQISVGSFCSHIGNLALDRGFWRVDSDCEGGPQLLAESVTYWAPLPEPPGHTSSHPEGEPIWTRMCDALTCSICQLVWSRRSKNTVCPKCHKDGEPLDVQA